jgi:hypothetical protein
MRGARKGKDVFTPDRLIDAAANIGIAVRMTAARPYGNGWRIHAASAGGA